MTVKRFQRMFEEFCCVLRNFNVKRDIRFESLKILKIASIIAGMIITRVCKRFQERLRNFAWRPLIDITGF